MATNPSEIQLSEEQRRRLAILADRTGRAWSELFDEALGQVPALPPAEHNGRSDRTLYAAMVETGLLGCIDGPGDLSTNPKHMEGFGTDGQGEDPD